MAIQQSIRHGLFVIGRRGTISSTSASRPPEASFSQRRRAQVADLLFRLRLACRGRRSREPIGTMLPVLTLRDGQLGRLAPSPFAIAPSANSTLFHLKFRRRASSLAVPMTAMAYGQ